MPPIWLALFLSLDVSAQDCRFWRDQYHQGPSYSLDIGESVTMDLDDGQNPSWEILHPWAAIKILDIDAPDSYPWVYMFSAESADLVGGTDQYDGANVTVTCLNKIDRPIPYAWIPIDGSAVGGFQTPVNEGAYTMPSPDSQVLKVTHAFIYENSEQRVCFGGGPFASINFGAYDADLFDDFGDDLDQLRAHFCLFWDWAHLEDDIAIVDGDTVGCHALCQTFVEDYGAPRGDIKLPGPVYTASNNCIGNLIRRRVD